MHDTPTRPTAAARPRRRPRLRHALLAVALVASALLLGPPSTTAGAAECGCTGEFVAPKATTAKVAGAAAPDGDTGLSKTGRYRLVNEYDQGAQAGRMRVVRVADGRELVTFPVDGSVNGWGFSPDEDRFVTFGHSSAALYDLASGGGKVLDLNRPATIGFSPKGTYAVAVWPEGNTAYASVHHAANGQLVRIGGSDRIQDSQYLGFGPDDTTLFVENTTARTSSLYALPSATRLYQRFGNPSSVGYSPDGSHVSVITLDGSQVHVAVVRTADGTIAYQTSFTASAPPIISEPDEKTGELKLDPQEAGGLGFSPDGGSYLVGTSDGSTARVTVVDLASGDEVLVRTNISGRATWAFSPCGHMFTLVTQALPTSRPRVEVRSTADGSLLGETTTPPGAVTVRATVDELAVDHEPEGGRETTVVGPNPICATFTLALPASLPGGSSASGTLTLDRAAPPGGFPLTLATDSPHLSVPASVVVPAGATTLAVPLTSTAPSADVDVTVTMRAAGRFSSEPVTLTVRVLATVLVDLSLDTTEVAGGSPATGTVTINHPAPTGGTRVALASDHAAVSVPASVTVPAGQTSATFPVTTTEVDERVAAELTATLGDSTRTTWLDLRPTYPTQLELLTVPGPTAVAGAPVTLSVRLEMTAPDDGDTHPGPEGTVVFSSGLERLGTAEVEGVWGATEARAELTVDALPVGAHTITARYEGSPLHRPSSGSVELEVVDGVRWTGAGDGRRFSDPDNWSAGRIPAPGEPVLIAPSEPTEIEVDAAGLTLAHLDVRDAVLTGEAVALSGHLSATGDVVIDTPISLPDGFHVIAAVGRLQLRGQISGPGAVGLHAGTIELAGANVHTGRTTISREARVRVLDPAALGSTDAATDILGTLCLAADVDLAEPLVVRGARLELCIDTLSDDWDAALAPGQALARVTGPVEVLGAVRILCAEELPVDAPHAYAHLALDGAISGAGAVEVCSGMVRFGGAAPNSYSGPTVIGREIVDGGSRDIGARLTLAKADGVRAASGAVRGDALHLAAAGQLDPTADVEVRELHLGVVANRVRDLDVDRLVVGTEDEAVGRIEVDRSARVAEVGVDAIADVPPGTAHEVVTARSAAPIAECPSGALARGSRVIDHRVRCDGGDGNDLILTALWHTEVAITLDPPDSARVGSDVTVTVTVTSPPGAPAATGLVDLWAWDHRGRWQPIAHLGTLTLSDGQATTTLPGDGTGAFSADYLPTTTHAEASSPMRRYDRWQERASTLPQPPGNLRADGDPWERSVHLEWESSIPAADVVAHRIDITDSAGRQWTEGTDTLWEPSFLAYPQFHTFEFYRVHDLELGETYTFRVRTLNSRGTSLASDPVTVTLELPTVDPGDPSDPDPEDPGDPDPEDPGDPGDDPDDPGDPAPEDPDDPDDPDPGDDPDPEAVPPAAPTDVSVTAGPAQVTVRWSAPADDGGLPVQRYVITPHVDGVPLAPVTTPGPATSYTVGGLRSDTAYTFTVAAVTAAGQGEASAPSAPVTPAEAPRPATVPTAPRSVQASSVKQDDGTRVVLSWARPASDGGSPITGYRVEARLARGQTGVWREVAVTGPTSAQTTFTLPATAWPSEPGIYHVRVVAENAVGQGPWSPFVYVEAVHHGRPGIIAPPPLSGDLFDPPMGLDQSNTTGPLDSSLSPGDSTWVTASGFEPGEPVRLELHSTPVHLGDARSDAAGTVRTRITVPADTPVGAHTLHLIGQRSGHRVTFPLDVREPGALPRTGSDGAALATTGWALLVAGALLLLARRRTAPA